MAQAPGSANGTVARSETGFDRAMEGLRATGASVDIADLVKMMAEHGRDEGRLLEQYQELAQSTGGATRYVIDIILDDERRHHRLLSEMANAMAWGTFGDPDEPATPTLGGGISRELSHQTARLRRREAADHRELLRMRARMRPFADTTLWGLLVDMMILDTQKHIAMLRFLERHRAPHRPPAAEAPPKPAEREHWLARWHRRLSARLMGRDPDTGPAAGATAIRRPPERR